MPLDFDQSARFLQCKTVFGDNVLLMRSFTGTEAISQPFRFRVEAISTNLDLAIQDAVGTSFTISAILGDALRFFNGVVLRMSAGETAVEQEEAVRIYRAEIVPSLFLMNFKKQCRVFENKSVADIINALWTEHGFSTANLTVSLPSAGKSAIEYCTQYNESNFQFLTRLLERIGACYYFEHADGSHKTVFTTPNSYGSDVGKVELSRQLMPRSITRWERQMEFTPGSFAHTDYNFEDSVTDLSATSPTARTQISGRDKYEVYEYPGGYAVSGDGKALADVRMGEYEIPDTVAGGTSTCPDFIAGGTFTLDAHPVSSEAKKQYVLTRVEHRAAEPTFAPPVIEEGDEYGFYTNEFACLPSDRPYVPPRVTPGPRIDSLQTATVVGATDDEPDSDKYGRVKVKFHWFRDGEYDEDALCYVRVAQCWAGAERGTLFIPRVGDEVVVAFLEGDPDRPLVVGSVYNDQRMPPWDLNASPNWMWSGLRTQSPGGQNELRFEDANGGELVLLYAFKDGVRVVGNREVVRVGFSDTVANDASAVSFADDSGAADGDQHVTVAQNRTVVVEGGDDTLTVNEGNLTIDVSSGECNITAATKIVLTCGESVIEMSPSEVKITGTNITVQASASGTFDGGGTTAVKGGIVNIN